MWQLVLTSMAFNFCIFLASLELSLATIRFVGRLVQSCMPAAELWPVPACAGDAIHVHPALRREWSGFETTLCPMSHSQVSNIACWNTSIRSLNETRLLGWLYFLVHVCQTWTSTCRSMYFDEDGDLAHEFYQEERVTSPSGVVRWRMKKIFDRLSPQVRKNVHTVEHVSVLDKVNHHFIVIAQIFEFLEFSWGLSKFKRHDNIVSIYSSLHSIPLYTWTLYTSQLQPFRLKGGVTMVANSSKASQL